MYAAKHWYQVNGAYKVVLILLVVSGLFVHLSAEYQRFYIFTFVVDFWFRCLLVAESSQKMPNHEEIANQIIYRIRWRCFGWI